MNDLVVELETIDLGDQRLNHRARRVLAKLGAKPQASIPAACGGWGETRAAYRLFDHPNVTAQQILEPHYRCSEQRIRQHRRVLPVTAGQAAAGTRALVMWSATSSSRVASAAASSGGALGRPGAISGRRTWS